MKAIKIDSRKKIIDFRWFLMILEPFLNQAARIWRRLTAFDGVWRRLGGYFGYFRDFETTISRSILRVWRSYRLENTGIVPNKQSWQDRGRSESFLNFYLKKTGFCTNLSLIFDDFWLIFGEFLKWHMGTFGRKSGFSGVKSWKIDKKTVFPCVFTHSFCISERKMILDQYCKS